MAKSYKKYKNVFNVIENRPLQGPVNLMYEKFSPPFIFNELLKTITLSLHTYRVRVERWWVCAAQTPQSWSLERLANLHFGTIRVGKKVTLKETFSQTGIRFNRIGPFRWRKSFEPKKSLEHWKDSMFLRFFF